MMRDMAFEWRDFRRGLRTVEREAFDAMVAATARFPDMARTGSTGFPMSGAVLAMLLAQEEEIARLRADVGLAERRCAEYMERPLPD